jgi:pimeloyl-ACP methyl ester carboxylesterase
MDSPLKKIGKYSYREKGEGQAVVVLHGLMGDLSNFDGVFNFFPDKGYRVIIPKLPVYTLPILKTNVKSLVIYVKGLIDQLNLDEVILLGNSLGGHISLYFTKLFPEYVKAIILTGSSGLYEKSMGSSYPKRGNREYVKKKIEEVFYDPSIATEELVDDIMETINDRGKIIRTLALAKSAIRHNMANDVPKMKMPACIVWGRNDQVTPPEVAEEFHRLFPDSDLFWIDQCGHAPMMEKPDEFNSIVYEWMKQRDI